VEQAWPRAREPMFCSQKCAARRFIAKAITYNRRNSFEHYHIDPEIAHWQT
jgi:hypothetical protein